MIPCLPCISRNIRRKKAKSGNKPISYYEDEVITGPKCYKKFRDHEARECSLCGMNCFLEKNLHRRGRLDNIEKYYRK